MWCRLIGIETIRNASTCLIGLGVLWQVAERASRGDVEVVIHVVEPDVEVLIDGYNYPFDPTPGVPLVCSLRPGRHTLTTTRQGRTIQDEPFTVDPGGNHVLTALDATRPVRSQKTRPSCERD